MASATIDAASLPRGRAERPMYAAAALVAALVVFAGFAPTYYLSSLFGAADLNTLKHIHGVVMTSWFVLFFVQARLAATGRIAIHRQLGLAGVFLAILVVAIGTTLGIAAARAGVTIGRPMRSPSAESCAFARPAASTTARASSFAHPTTKSAAILPSAA